MTDLFPFAADLGAARSQMAFTLGFHIILACLGVGLPAIILIANWIGLRRNDEVALGLAKRWSKVAAVTFVVGAITGTVLSFEMGLLWPEFMRRFGDVFGLAFALEGIFFFTEAIFIAIYIYGWKHLSGWTHFWTGVPVLIAGLGGAWSVVAANSWMNQPDGFKLASDGTVTDVSPLDAFFNGAVGYEAPHLILAAYLVTGYLVASVYAVGMLRGRRDRHHRLGLLIPLTMAVIMTPIQFAVGDTAARAIAKDQPIKFAAMECVQETHTHVTEYLGGRCTSDGVKGGIGIPGLDSWLVGFSTDTKVIGLDTVPPDDRPPANTMLHWAFDAMVGICSAMILLGLWLGDRVVAQARHPEHAVVPARRRHLRGGGHRRARVRLDRHGGRAPALDRLRGDAHRGRGHPGRRRVGQPRRRVRRLRGARGRDGRHLARDVPSLAGGRRRRCSVRAAPRCAGPARGAAVSSADAVAAVLWVGVTLYAVFGGADFGGGFWALVAGNGERGRRAHALIDWAIGPVWEANHVWLIFMLVTLWTGFPEAFSSVMSTLFIPLSLAALGIVLRGAGFAFQRVAARSSARRFAEWSFAVSSVVTPFFMGTVVGAVASGRVPVGNAAGDAVTSWLNPVSLVLGVLFVATGAYLAAVFLVSDARRFGDPDLVGYFAVRARAAAVVAGALAVAGIVALHSDARFVYDGLTSEALPLVLVSVVCGLGAMVLLWRGALRGVRPLAVAAVVAVIWGWGVAQYPYLLPQTLTIDEGAGASETLTAVLVVFGIAVVVVLPALALLFTLDQRSLLEEEGER